MSVSEELAKAELLVKRHYDKVLAESKRRLIIEKQREAEEIRLQYERYEAEAERKRLETDATLDDPALLAKHAEASARTAEIWDAAQARTGPIKQLINEKQSQLVLPMCRCKHSDKNQRPPVIIKNHDKECSLCHKVELCMCSECYPNM